MASADAAKETGRLVRPTSVSARPASAVDATEIAMLYERRFRAFVGGAYAVVGEPEAARDVVQEAFARALRDRRRFRAEGTLEAWLWRIVVNVARHVAGRRRLRHSRGHDVEPHHHDSDPDRARNTSRPVQVGVAKGIEAS
jgi:DNA-directed RNA polymerase specialized sigma24 family protein